MENGRFCILGIVYFGSTFPIIALHHLASGDRSRTRETEKQRQRQAEREGEKGRERGERERERKTKGSKTW